LISDSGILKQENQVPVHRRDSLRRFKLAELVSSDASDVLSEGDHSHILPETISLQDPQQVRLKSDERQGSEEVEESRTSRMRSGNSLKRASSSKQP
jgi:hypothetical protein